MKMLFMGAPGCGKGTQAKIASEKLGIPAISTGELLREAIAKQTPEGVTAAGYMDEGNLVPDEIVVTLLLKRLGERDCGSGYILDGFPRTRTQAELLEKAGIIIDSAVMLEVPDEDIIQRAMGRRICGECGDTYHILFNRPLNDGFCDKCGNNLIIRPDDNPDTVRIRLETYHKLTKPVISYYEEQGKLIRIRANGSVEEVSKLLLTALETGEGL